MILLLAANGMEVVQQIAAVETGNNGGHSDVPTTPVVINKVSHSGE